MPFIMVLSSTLINGNRHKRTVYTVPNVYLDRPRT